MSKFKKIVGALIVALLLPLLSAPPANAAIICGQNGWYCTTKLDRNDVTFADGTYVQFSLYYRMASRQPDAPRVKPLYAIVSYNMPGTRQTCHEVFRRYDGVRYNWYFWRPYTGENHNPPAGHIPCDESTQNSEIQDFDNVPWLEFGPGYGSDRQPRWRVNITLQRNGAEDWHKAYGQDFNPL